MKKTLAWFVLGALILVSTGCSSYYELDFINNNNACMKNVRIDNGEKVLATYSSVNMAYLFFGLIPFESGKAWLSGDCPEDYDGGMTFFKNECTLDNSLKSLKAALKQAKSNRICNLVNEETTSFTWSLGVIHRRIIRTNCLILEPQQNQSPEQPENQTQKP